MKSLRIILVSLLLTIMFYSCGFAQRNPIGFSITGGVSIPQEDFANVSEPGAVLAVAFMCFPWVRPFHGARIDLGFTRYGTDTREIPGGEIETKRYSLMSTLGFQLSAPVGPVLLYLTPACGIYHYWTDEKTNAERIGDTTFETTKLGWNVGAGLFIRLGGDDSKEGGCGGIEITTRYHTIHNIVRSEVEEQERDANEISIHVGFLGSPTW